MEYRDRGEEFEALFNVVEETLRRKVSALDLKRNGRPSFAESVRILRPIDGSVARYADELLEFGELRNAIVHSRGRDGLRVIAEPVPEALEEFRAIVTAITEPRLAITLSGGAPRHFSPTDPLVMVLDHLREYGYAQVVVKSGRGDLRLLSASGIVGYFANQAATRAIRLDDHVLIQDALKFEPKHNFQIVSRLATEDDVRRIVESYPITRGVRLQAIIVTEHGRPSEKALGIITPLDLFRADQR